MKPSSPETGKTPVSQIQGGFAAVAAGVREVAQDVRQQGSEKVEEVHALLEEKRDDVGKALESAKHWIKAHPLESAAIGFGIGYLVGTLAKRGR
ncbi:MAG: hypothetical protein ACKVPX_00215 [Myxococcaceae bacterium]